MSAHAIGRNLSEISQLRYDLALALGFTEHQAVTLAEPYLNYIENRHTGDGSSEEFLRFFIKTVLHFQTKLATEKEASTQSSLPSHDVNSLQTFIDSICKSPNEAYFAHTRKNSTLRKELVTDTVLYILGAWVAMLSYFVKLPSGYRQIELAYYIRHGSRSTNGFGNSLKENISGLLKGSGLLPSPNDSQDPFSSILSNRQTVHDVSNHNQAPQGLNGAASPSFNSHFSSYCLKSDLSTSALRGIPTLHTRIDSLESLSIKSSTLNAYTLSSLGGIRIHWTMNLSRHLLLSRFAGRDVLEVFALPCVLRGGAKSLCAAGVPQGLITEIQESYSILFNATGRRSMHGSLAKVVCLRWLCWCRSCSLRRLQQRELTALRKSKNFPNRRKTSRSNVRSEFDPLLEELMRNPDPEDWSYELFPHLWDRIVALEEHLGNSKPWNFWVLLRDRRDTLQFWTFFFGSVILVLTVIQVGLGAAQVVGSF